MKLHDNWYRSWSIGRLEFEVEWVPRAKYYTFSLTIKSPSEVINDKN